MASAADAAESFLSSLGGPLLPPPIPPPPPPLHTGWSNGTDAAAGPPFGPGASAHRAPPSEVDPAMPPTGGWEAPPVAAPMPPPVAAPRPPPAEEGASATKATRPDAAKQSSKNKSSTGEEDRRKKKSKEEEERSRAKRLDTIPEASDGSAGRVHADHELLAPYRFDNALPEIPSDPKLLVHHFDRDAYVRYNYDSVIEREHRYELLAEPDLGINIDLVDPTVYEAAPGAELHPADKELLNTAASGERAAVLGARQATKQIREGVTWLRKTPILGNNLYESIHKHPKEQVETRHVVKESRELAMHGSDLGRRTLSELVDSIEKSFDAAEALEPGKITHPTDKNLRAEAVMPIMPDFEGWSNSYVQMVFDIDPALEAPGDTTPRFPRHRVGQAIVKGSATQAREGHAPQQYVAYLLPKEGGEGSEGEGADGGEAARSSDEPKQYEWIREYAYEVRREHEGESYFFAMQPDRVVYNEFSSKMNLTRKTFRAASARPKEITLSRRELAEDESEEHSTRRQRLTEHRLRITQRDA